MGRGTANTALVYQAQVSAVPWHYTQAQPCPCSPCAVCLGWQLQSSAIPNQMRPILPRRALPHQCCSASTLCMKATCRMR